MLGSGTDTSLYRPVVIGRLIVPGNIFAAPMAGYSDRVGRYMALNGGADLAYTEMISAEALVRGSVRTRDMLIPARGERFLAVQLFGSNIESLKRAAFIAAEKGAAILDLNAGCPVPKVTKNGAGAALGGNPSLLGKLIKAMSESGLPVTVKIRSGWDEEHISWPDSAHAAIDAGAAAIGFHPRTRRQLYGGRADWRILKDLVQSSPIPVIGSGDLEGPESVQRMLHETGCAAVMVARGAIGNPDIFRQSRELIQKGQTGSAPETAWRINLAQTHLLAALDTFGEELGSKTIKKHLARYIRGFDGSAELRSELMRAEGSQAMLRILAAYQL